MIFLSGWKVAKTRGTEKKSTKMKRATRKTIQSPGSVARSDVFPKMSKPHCQLIRLGHQFLSYKSLRLARAPKELHISTPPFVFWATLGNVYRILLGIQKGFCDSVTHRINALHIWYVYLHLLYKSAKCIGRYTIHGCYGLILSNPQHL